MASFKHSLFLTFFCLFGVLFHPNTLLAAEEFIAEQIVAFQNETDKKHALILGRNILNSPQVSLHQKISVLQTQANIYYGLGDYDSAILVSKKVQKIAQQSELEHIEAKAYKSIGIYHYLKGENSPALAAYQTALSFYQSTPDVIQQANLLNNIGLVQIKLGNTVDALNSYKLAESIYEKHGSEMDKIDIRYNIAIIYVQLRWFDSAIPAFQEVIKKRKEIDDQRGLASAYSDIGISYKQAGQYQKALDYLFKAFEYYQEKNDLFNLASTFHNLAEVYNDDGQAIKGQEFAEKSLAISEERGYNNAYTGALHSLAKSYYAQGMINQSIEQLNLSTKIAEENGYQQQLLANAALYSLIYASQNDFINASKTQREFIFKYHQRANKSLNDQLALFESEKLKQQVNRLEQDQQLQQLKIDQVAQQRNLIIIAILFVVITILFILRRKADHQLKLSLETKVKQRTGDLEQLADELKQANTVKSKFLANMSHEIRTPLTAIIGQSEAIIHGDVDSKSVMKEVKVVYENSLHLLELINNILDLSKVEANKIELELRYQDLHIILRELANMFTEQANAKGLNFEIVHSLPTPFNLEIDGFRLKQILINLCSNAIKFTHQGNVSVTVSATDDDLNFAVSDTGIGLSYMQLQQVFDSFTQGESSISRRFGGSGLGLCLSEQLAKLMDGKIEVESVLDHGSTFKLILPATYDVEIPAAETPVKVTTDTVNKLSKKLSGEILLADDHDDNRRLIARLLSSLGLDVITAKDGKEAIELYLEYQPEVILLDIQMPEIDGVEAFKILRQKGCTQPIVALTANAMAHEVDQYLALGFDGHLKKPIERKVFTTTIAKYYDNELNVEESEATLNNVDLSDLVAQFKSNLTLELQDLILHIKDNDIDNLSALAHRIAGAAQMFGFALLSEKAIKLELAIKTEKTEDINELSQELLNEIDQVLW